MCWKPCHPPPPPPQALTHRSKSCRQQHRQSGAESVLQSTLRPSSNLKSQHPHI